MTRFYKLNKELVDKRYKTFKSKVNMSYSEMIAWKKDKCAYSASIKVNEVINRVTRLLKKPKITWTQKDYIDSGKVISYISRASKIKDSSKPANKKWGCLKGKNFYALKNWAYDRNKVRKNPKYIDIHLVDLLISAYEFQSVYTVAAAINYYNQGEKCDDCEENAWDCECEWCEDCDFRRCMCDLGFTNYDWQHSDVKIHKQNMKKIRQKIITFAKEVLNNVELDYFLSEINKIDK